MKSKLFTLSIILLLTLFCSGTLRAQKLIIWQKDGSKVSYKLDDKPKTTFTTDELVITTTTATISFPLSQIQRYTYDNLKTNVDNVKVKGISISQHGDIVIVKGLEKGNSVIVCSVDGKQLMAKKSDGSDSLTLSLSKLSAGVFVIKANEVTYKFSKR